MLEYNKGKEKRKNESRGVDKQPLTYCNDDSTIDIGAFVPKFISLIQV